MKVNSVKEQADADEKQYPPYPSIVRFAEENVVDEVIKEGQRKAHNRIISLIIDDGITKISDNVFHDLKYLSSVSLPNTLTHIGNGSFYSCKFLQSITIPGYVMEIGRWAFNNCDMLERVDFISSRNILNDNSVYQFRCLMKQGRPNSSNTVIGNFAKLLIQPLVIKRKAFQDCPMLKNVSIPRYVKIEDGAFDEKYTKYETTSVLNH